MALKSQGTEPDAVRTVMSTVRCKESFRLKVCNVSFWRVAFLLLPDKNSCILNGKQHRVGAAI